MALDEDGYPISEQELLEETLREMRRRESRPDGVPETTTALAFNGHLMVYPYERMQGNGKPYYSQSRAWCAGNCPACAAG